MTHSNRPHLAKMKRNWKPGRKVWSRWFSSATDNVAQLVTLVSIHGNASTGTTYEVVLRLPKCTHCGAGGYTSPRLDGAWIEPRKPKKGKL